MEGKEFAIETFSLLKRFTNQYRFYDKLFIYYIFLGNKNRLEVATNVQGGVDELK